MTFLSISRSLPPAAPPPDHVAEGGVPEGTQTATYLSTESLTFPGVTGVASLLLVVIAKLAGHDLSKWWIVCVAVAFGVVLIVLGLIDPKRDDKSAFGTTTQIIVGVLNTVVLLSALLGLASVTDS